MTISAAIRCGVGSIIRALDIGIIGALDIGKYADFAFLDADLREKLTGLLNGYGRSQAWFDPTHRGLCSRGLCSRFGARDPGERYL